jgi:hypothetical protein
MTTYRLDHEPTHVLDEGNGPLPGHYEVEFAAGGGRMLRYLTDKGRAEVLRRMGEGKREFTEDEVRELTVEPDIDMLVAQMEREAGEGG